MPTTTNDAEQLHSVSALARLFDLDRATVAKRLAEADVQPTKESKREKLYALKDALLALTSQGASSDLEEARRKKVELETARLQLLLDRERGELLPVRDVRDMLQRIFKRLHNSVCVQYPRDGAAQLYKADSVNHVAETLQRDLSRKFNDLRNDHSEFLA